jgi:Tol biopolymer transport system component
VVSTHGLNFGAEDEQLTLVITNSGTGTLGWNISGNQPWIEVSPASGSTTTEPDDVAVTVNREGMDPGTHYGEVTVDAGAAGVETVDVEASVADATAPATVQDLSITSISEFTMQLTWEAPGDDGMEGQAESYDLRYSLTPLTEQNWESAQSVSPLPTPGPSGSRDATDVEGLFSLTTYHFGLKSTDDSGNESGLSNTVAGSTLPLEPVQLTFDGEYDYVCAPAWSPRGDLIAYESCRDDFRGNIWVVSSGGGSAVKLTEGADGGGRMPCWSPDGSWIAFVRDDDEHIERIWKVPVSGGHAIQVTEGGGGYHEMPAWSPDGSQIAYIDWVVGQGSQIFLVPSSGGSGAALEIAVALNPISLSWSPDGLSLAFTTVSCRLYAVSSAGGYARPVANGFASGPDWSSCGEWIAFSGEVEGASKTCVVHSEAYEGHSYSLTTDAFEYGQPSWSPDGSRLVVISDRSGIYQLWIIGFRLEPE